MKPKLIIFDLFGTLIFPLEKIKREDFFTFYQKMGIDLKTEEDLKLFISLFSQLMGQTENWLDFSQKLLGKVIGKVDQILVEKLANFFRENIIYQMYEDVQSIIDFPQAKAILTTGSQFLFSDLGLEKYFAIFTPKETKFLKPDKRAFLAVLEKFGILAKEALMVGDEIEKDLIPAKSLGMEVILLDRENKIKDSPIRKISSLKELGNLLV